MNIEDLTIKEAREIAALFNAAGTVPTATPSAFWVAGKNYLIRTVTMIDTGTLVSIDNHEIILKDASWVADTGMFAAALVSCNYSEVEPFPSGLVAINRGSVIDAVQVATVPRIQK